MVSQAHAFPADDQWVEVLRLGVPMADPSGDPAPDIVGSSSDGALAWFADASVVSFRVRLDDPTTASAGVVGVVLNRDGDGATYDVLLVADGPGNEVAAYTADGAAGLQPTWTRVDGEAAGVRVRVAAPYLDFEISRSIVETAGWASDEAGFGTVMTGSAVGTWTDVLGCADLACAPADLYSVAMVVDTDSDGLTTPQELYLGLPPTDADADDDGLLDSQESAVDDLDEDGLVDARDCDSDGDGIVDGVELGVTEPTSGTAENGCFSPDQDPGTTTDPAVGDTDGGGLLDGVEDVNRNGAVDAWETDPNDRTDDADVDGDGIADVLEAQGDDGVIDDLDSDGDGLVDAVEWLWDIDEDGIPAFQDADSDGDGFPDSEEGAADTDADGWVDALDLDSDADGRADADEGRGDLDCDGIENRLDGDDFDGYCDSAEVDPNFEDENIERPAGELGRCAHGSPSLWLAPLALLLVRRKR